MTYKERIQQEDANVLMLLQRLTIKLLKMDFRISTFKIRNVYGLKQFNLTPTIGLMIIFFETLLNLVHPYSVCPKMQDEDLTASPILTNIQNI